MCNVTTLANGYMNATGQNVADGDANGPPCFWNNSCSIDYTCNAGYVMSGEANSSCVAPGVSNTQVATISPSAPTCNQGRTPNVNLKLRFYAVVYSC